MKVQITFDTDYPAMATVLVDNKKVGGLNKVDLAIQFLDGSRQKEAGVDWGPPEFKFGMKGYRLGAKEDPLKISKVDGKPVIIEAQLEVHPVLKVPDEQVENMKNVFQHNRSDK